MSLRAGEIGDDASKYEADLMKADEARKALMISKENPYFKALKLWPLGSDLVSRVVNKMKQLTQDKTFGGECEELVKLAKALGIVEVDSFIVDGKLTKPALPKFEDMHKRAAHLKSNASPSFLHMSDAKIKAIEQPQKTLLRNLRVAAYRLVSSQFGKHATGFLQHLETIGKAGKKEIVPAPAIDWSQIAQSVPVKLVDQFKSLVSIPSLRELQEEMTCVQRYITMIGSVAPWFLNHEENKNGDLSAEALRDYVLASFGGVAFGSRNINVVKDLSGAEELWLHLKVILKTSARERVVNAIQSSGRFVAALTDKSVTAAQVFTEEYTGRAEDVEDPQLIESIVMCRVVRNVFAPLWEAPERDLRLQYQINEGRCSPKKACVDLVVAPEIALLSPPFLAFGKHLVSLQLCLCGDLDSMKACVEKYMEGAGASFSTAVKTFEESQLDKEMEQHALELLKTSGNMLIDSVSKIIDCHVEAISNVKMEPLLKQAMSWKVCGIVANQVPTPLSSSEDPSPGKGAKGATAKKKAKESAQK